MRMLINIIPPVEPIPNVSTYASATSGWLIVDNTRSISAPLPASPWTMPTIRGRRCNLKP